MIRWGKFQGCKQFNIQWWIVLFRSSITVLISVQQFYQWLRVGCLHSQLKLQISFSFQFYQFLLYCETLLFGMYTFGMYTFRHCCLVCTHCETLVWYVHTVVWYVHMIYFWWTYPLITNNFLPFWNLTHQVLIQPFLLFFINVSRV